MKGAETSLWTRSGMRLGLAWLTCLALQGAMLAAADDPEPSDKNSESPAVGRKVPNFVLPDQNGEQVALADFNQKRTVVLFTMGTGCPISNLYLTELGKLHQRFAERGLQLIGINSIDGVTSAKLAKHVKEFKVTFPVLLDADQGVADMLGAKRTAEVFLLDGQRIVRYHGRVDDRFGYTYKREKATRNDLEEALVEVLAGKPVSVTTTKPLGCLITHRKRSVTTQITFAKQVSRIIQRRCQECHRPGMVAPFSLMTYEDVLGWTDMIKEVIIQRRMPPWHADPRYGRFSSDRSLRQGEIDTLVTWIDSGAPMGDAKDLPPKKKYAEGWLIDKPDQIFYLPKEVTVQADGVVPYLYFTVPSNFKEDVWVQAAELRPGNRAVVHHLIVYYRDPKTGKRGRIHGFAPGELPLVCPPGTGRRIPAGSDLIFQMHYTPTGKVEQDRSMIGLIYCKGDQPPKREAITKGIVQRRLAIPPGESSYRAKASYTFDRDVQIFSMMPHMNVRGKDFMYTAVYPDGRKEILLWVPQWDFNWQNTYRYATPKRLPKGTRIDCVAHYDNSTENLAKPDPTKTIRWGQQTWDEMMIGYVHYMAAGPVQKSVDLPDSVSVEPVGQDADADPQPLKHPIAYTSASIARGKFLYRSTCVDCHSFDGTGRDSDVTDNATDLTDISEWVSDGSDVATFLAIRDGVGDEMPGFKDDFKDEKLLWHMVNYLRSLQKKK